MKPPKSILDPEFKYVHSSKTSLAKTFARIRREQEAIRKAEEQARPSAKVTNLKRGAK